MYFGNPKTHASRTPHPAPPYTLLPTSHTTFLSLKKKKKDSFSECIMDTLCSPPPVPNPKSAPSPSSSLEPNSRAWVAKAPESNQVDAV